MNIQCIAYVYLKLIYLEYFSCLMYPIHIQGVLTIDYFDY